MSTPKRPAQPAKIDHGLIVPLVTPVNNDGKLDEPALRRVVDHVIAGGAQGVFVLGTTGESPSVPRAWRSRIVHIAAEQAGGRARVYAGLIDTAVADLYAAAAEFRQKGADGLVATLPYYFPLSAAEQFSYFSALVKTVELPVLLYDIPVTVHAQIDLAVIEHLRVFENVVGIKESSGDRERLSILLERYAGDSGFAILVGATELSGYGVLNGADGIVPAFANLEPGLCARLYTAARKGDTGLVDSLQKEVDALTGSNMTDGGISRLIPRLKRQMSQRGLCGPRVLAPLKQEE